MSVLQECFAGVSHKSVPQECPRRVPHNSVPRRLTVSKRVLHESVPQECSIRASPQECPTKVRHKSVLQKYATRVSNNGWPFVFECVCAFGFVGCILFI